MSRLLDDIRDVQPQATLELSPREGQVLELMADGLTRAEIGRRLGISEEMVKDYTARIRRRLGARNAAHAVALGFRSGMLI